MNIAGGLRAARAILGLMKEPRIDDLEDVHRRMRISNLEARLELHEIEIAALSKEIASPLTSLRRREEARALRDLQQAEWWEIKAELDGMRKLNPPMDWR